MANAHGTTPARLNRNAAPQLVLPLRTPDDDWMPPFYVKVGTRYERADDALVIERAQQLIAKDSREGLHRSLNKKGNPSLDTVTKVVRALGLKMTLRDAA